MYALPQFMPGKNEVRLAVANPDVLAKTKFKLEFAWDQDGKTKTATHTIDKSPYTFTVDIPSKDDLPRMRYVKMSNE